MFSLTARVDNVLSMPGGRNNKTGEVYEPYQQAQVTYFTQTKVGERKLMHSDINLPRVWGEMKDLTGKTVAFPVEITSVNWDLNIKIPEDANKPIISLDAPLAPQAGATNGSKKTAGASA
ncbi:MAG: hypothetical protein H8E32_05350 [Nitrospinae bacterium]|nr:hypothetical protein [Nitrospinota bacterium]